MNPDALDALVLGQRRLFDSGATRDVGFRLEQLGKLRRAVLRWERDIEAALHADLRKPPFEVYATETGFAQAELACAIRNVKRWSRPRRAAAPLSQFPSVCRVYPEPYGTVLIVVPWNYPVQLALVPLVSALAAGNTAVVKPSERAPRSSALLARLIADTFDPALAACVEGDAQTAEALLRLRWDYIFFTGSSAKARMVMRAAAEHLTPVTLQLGGKNPCIVDPTVDIRITARRIAWGKFMNAGQTCVAPDYVLADRRIKDRLVAAIRAEIGRFYGTDPALSPDYGRLVDERHVALITEMLAGAGEPAPQGIDEPERYVGPTVLDDVSWEHPAMRQEIFGPILPVIGYTDIREEIERLKRGPRPLALFVFTRDARLRRTVLRELSFGGGCVNQTVAHLIPVSLPFGGVGESGLGMSHGKAGFDTFTHYKSVLSKPFFLDLPLRYPPFTRLKMRLLRFVR